MGKSGVRRTSERSLQRHLRVKIQTFKNGTFLATLMDQEIQQQQEQINGTYPGGGYDEQGALWFVVIVMLVYGSLIVMMITCLMTNQKEDTIVMRYLQDRHMVKKIEKKQAILRACYSLHQQRFKQGFAQYRQQSIRSLQQINIENAFRRYLDDLPPEYHMYVDDVVAMSEKYRGRRSRSLPNAFRQLSQNSGKWRGPSYHRAASFHALPRSSPRRPSVSSLIRDGGTSCDPGAAMSPWSRSGGSLRRGSVSSHGECASGMLGGRGASAPATPRRKVPVFVQSESSEFAEKYRVWSSPSHSPQPSPTVAATAATAAKREMFRQSRESGNWRSTHDCSNAPPSDAATRSRRAVFKRANTFSGSFDDFLPPWASSIGGAFGGRSSSVSEVMAAAGGSGLSRISEDAEFGDFV